jgi:ABC-type uncharacterized transport system substrate-binding protein
VLVYNRRTVRSALKYRLASCGFPGIRTSRRFVAYGIDFPDISCHAATFVDTILTGVKPVDLPVERTTNFVTIGNLKIAKANGVEVPTSLLLRADQVIE